MEMIGREQLPVELLPGRAIQRAVGQESPISSHTMTAGFARYSAESGPMQPHHHAEETVIVLDAKNGYVRWGETAGKMGERIPLYSGMVLHFPAQEWHVFEYIGDGFVDIVFLYGQTDDVRPEERKT